MPRAPTPLSGHDCPECAREMTTVTWQYSKDDVRITVLCIFCNVNHGPLEEWDEHSSG